MSSNKAVPTENCAPATFAAEGNPAAGGLEFVRWFTHEGKSPYDEIEWEIRTAVIASEQGGVLFQQEGVEIPKSWSQTATNIVVSKYFHGQVGTPQREKSVRQLVDRVVRTMTDWGIKGGYFASEADADVFHDELAYLLLNQYAAFNSPVWFNCGIEPKPQCSACFINRPHPRARLRRRHGHRQHEALRRQAGDHLRERRRHPGGDDLLSSGANLAVDLGAKRPAP